MKVYGTLDRAAFETISDPSQGVTGRFWWNSTEGRVKTDDGTNIRALLRNDSKAVIGNNATANNNIRLHRGASGLLQFVQGGDVTAEGTLSTSLNQISFKIESYTNSGKPAFGNAGRFIWVTDIPELQVDSGAAWVSVAVGNRISAVYDFVVGSSAQVSSGIATHSTWASAIAAASAGNVIKILEGTWVENITITKQLYIEGNGYGTYLNGSFTFDTSSDRSSLRNLRLGNSITLNSGVTLCNVDSAWLASGKTFVDNGTGNLLSGFQET